MVSTRAKPARRCSSACAMSIHCRASRRRPTEVAMIPKQVFAESILQFLSPVAVYLSDPLVSEVMINGPRQIYVERAGRLELTNAAFASEEAVVAALRNIGQAC